MFGADTNMFGGGVKAFGDLPSKNYHNFSNTYGRIGKTVTCTWEVLIKRIRYLRMTGGIWLFWVFAAGGKKYYGR